MKKYLLLLMFLQCGYWLVAQDINFSQFNEFPLLRNPSLAGLFIGDFRVTSSFRSQWGSVSVPYKTQAVAADVKFSISEMSDDYLSIGLQATHDVAGDGSLGKTQLFPTLAFHKSLSSNENTYFSIGFSGGAVNQRFDASRLKFDDQFVNGAYSPLNATRQSFSNTNFTYYDAAVGVLLSCNLNADIQAYIGSGFFHFTEPRVAFNSENDIRLNKKLVFNGGVHGRIGDYSDFTVYADYFTQGGNRLAQGGFLFRHMVSEADENNGVAISAGSFLRWEDALIPILKLEFNRLAVAASYDVNVSTLRTASQSRGGLEFVLSYRSAWTHVPGSAKRVRCPVGF